MSIAFNPVRNNGVKPNLAAIKERVTTKATELKQRYEDMSPEDQAAFKQKITDMSTTFHSTITEYLTQCKNSDPDQVDKTISAGKHAIDKLEHFKQEFANNDIATTTFNPPSETIFGAPPMQGQANGNLSLSDMCNVLYSGGQSLLEQSNKDFKTWQDMPSGTPDEQNTKKAAFTTMLMAFRANLGMANTLMTYSSSVQGKSEALNDSMVRG
jgi:hypothetical protein